MVDKNDISYTDNEVHEIYFNQLHTVKSKLEFVNSIFEKGIDETIDNYFEESFSKNQIRIKFVSEASHYKYGLGTMVIDGDDILHISASKINMIKHILYVFKVQGYIVTEVEKPYMRYKSRYYRFYKTYQILNNNIQTLLPISLS